MFMVWRSRGLYKVVGQLVNKIVEIETMFFTHNFASPETLKSMQFHILRPKMAPPQDPPASTHGVEPVFQHRPSQQPHDDLPALPLNLSAPRPVGGRPGHQDPRPVGGRQDQRPESGRPGHQDQRQEATKPKLKFGIDHILKKGEKNDENKSVKNGININNYSS